MMLISELRTLSWTQSRGQCFKFDWLIDVPYPQQLINCNTTEIHLGFPIIMAWTLSVHLSIYIYVLSSEYQNCCCQTSSVHCKHVPVLDTLSCATILTLSLLVSIFTIYDLMLTVDTQKFVHVQVGGIIDTDMKYIGILTTFIPQYCHLAFPQYQFIHAPEHWQLLPLISSSTAPSWWHLTTLS